jgi:hypothetical protein
MFNCDELQIEVEDGNVFYDESVKYNVNEVYIAAKQFIKN